MAKLMLKQEIIDRIREEPKLYCEISEELGIKPLSLPKLLRENHVKLTQIGVLKVIQRNSKGIQNTNSFLEKQAS